MKIMKASNYFAVLPPGSGEALAGRDCQGFICACMCVSFANRRAPEARQPRQDGSRRSCPANSRCCAGLPAAHPPALRGRGTWQRSAAPKGVASSSPRGDAPGCSRRACAGTRNHSVVRGQLFSGSNMLCFPGTKPKAADPAQHLTKELSKVIFRRI